jgi:hypothetical protein
MKRALSFHLRSTARLFAVVATSASIVAAGRLAAQTPVASPGFAAIHGFIVDSVHATALAQAWVKIEGTTRQTRTSDEGRYVLDSIPPGQHRVIVSHPLLDTIGFGMATRPMNLAAGQVTSVDLAIPSGDRIVSLLCPAAVLKLRGPGALVGFVKDPESGGPAVGSRVELIYEESDPLGFKKTLRKREATVDSTGSYRICGIPTPMTGKVQVFRNGISSGEVAAAIEQGSLGLRSLSIAAVQVATVATDSGKSMKVYRGSSRLTGRIVNKQGQPLAGARVTVEGSGITAISRATGDFTLDSLPAGTQSLDVRKLGYGATEKAVELSSVAPASVTVVMGDYVPTLQTMRVEAERDKGLSDVGYLERKQTGLGHYMDGDNLRTDALKFSDAMRIAPGLKVTPLGDGRSYVIESARDPNGCVTYVVDGSRWTQMTPGDIDDFVRPDELRAVEIYNASTVPGQFQQAGMTKCATIVIWTVRSTNRPRKR